MNRLLKMNLQMLKFKLKEKKQQRFQIIDLICYGAETGYGVNHKTISKIEIPKSRRRNLLFPGDFQMYMGDSG